MAEHTRQGDLWNFIWQNITLGQKASLLWAVGAGRYVQTCGLFMLGYFPIGLNLALHCGYAVSLLIGIAFFFAQIRFCHWWAARHKHGPLEEIWHRLTWIKS